jgi:regulator of nucleoside diphosphate kinase
MTSTKAARRPPIHMIDREADILTDLALEVEKRLPEISNMLLGEIARATVHTPQRTPRDVVTMHATVEFIDEASGAQHTAQLVYPKDADIAQGRISILTPIGAGLIGLREGQSILWPRRDGQERRLTIVKVTQRQDA